MELLKSYCNLVDETSRLCHLIEEAIGSKRATSTKPVPRASAKRLSKKQVAEITARYEAGESVKDIAVLLGVDRQTVGKYLNQARVPRRPRSMSESQIDEAVRLYEQGLSLAKVGERTGFTAWTVLRAVRERGTPIRDTHGRAR